MALSKANAVWNGGLKDGNGKMKPAHAPELTFSFGSRFEGQPATNPEELIGAALAGCFSMALSANLERAGVKPESIRTSAQVHLEKQADGFSITRIDLESDVQAAGLDDAQFQQIASETKKSCPVSKALTGPQITLQARLAVEAR